MTDRQTENLNPSEPYDTFAGLIIITTTTTTTIIISNLDSHYSMELKFRAIHIAVCTLIIDTISILVYRLYHYNYYLS